MFGGERESGTPWEGRGWLAVGVAVVTVAVRDVMRCRMSCPVL